MDGLESICIVGNHLAVGELSVEVDVRSGEGVRVEFDTAAG